MSDLLDIEAGTEKLAFFAGDLKLATLEKTATPTLAFHHPDHLTSAGVDTDGNGNIVQLTDYYPYGDSRIEEASGSFHNDYTYTGKERDEDTELLYYEARYYDSHLGRFISLDPAGGDIKDPQSFNKYAYVRNNPLKYVDPEGKDSVNALTLHFYNLYNNYYDAYKSMFNDVSQIKQGANEVADTVKATAATSVHYAVVTSPYTAAALTLALTKNPKAAATVMQAVSASLTVIDVADSYKKSPPGS